MTRPLPFRLALAALATLASGLGACSPEPPETPATPDAGPNALVLGTDGIAGLDGATPFDTAAVRAALPPGFTVEVRSVETEAGRVPVLWALRDGRLVLEVYAGADGATVGRIDAADEGVAGPTGLRVGRTFAEADGADMDCEPGAEELSGRAVCRPDGGPVRYVFASRSTGPDGALPPADSLADALLERLVWTEE